MFDPKQLLEILVQGGGPQRAPASDAPAVSNDISDLLRQFTQGAPGSDAPQRPRASDDTPSQAQGGGLEDLLSELQRRAGGAGETAGDVFGQATEGVREGAGKIGRATGLDDIITQLGGGRSPQELIEEVQRYMEQNKLGTGAVLGGLGALILGTRTGRSFATSAAKIGALALIGGLAYKAYQNYQAGRPLITDRSETPQAAPRGSGFGEDALSTDATVTCIRAMIAAAAADGRLDSAEQQRIIGSLKEQGVDAEAEEFLARELNNPASVEDLINSSRSREEDVQIYTAARIAIDPDTDAEQRFLALLGKSLGLEEELLQHVNATARQATV